MSRMARRKVMFCALLAGALAACLLLATAAVAGPPVGMTRIEDDSLRLSWSGAWTTSWQPGASGESERISGNAGSWVQASFTGTGCALVTRTGPSLGRARVYVDGAPAEELDLYGSSAAEQQSVWATDTLTAGAHTVRIVVLGSKNASSSAVAIPVDAFDLVGAPGAAVLGGKLVNNGSSMLATRGKWGRAYRPSAINGSAWRTSTTGSSVTLRFRGTSVAWLGSKDPGCGKAEVLVDGRRVAVVSQYRSPAEDRRVLWAKSGLPYGVHNVTVRSLGATSAVGGGRAVDVDAFVYSGTLMQARRPTPFKYPWKTYIVIDKSEFKLYWVKNGYLIKTYPIAYGKVSSWTPVATWRIDAKYRTDPGSVYGPRKMRMFKRVSTSSGYRYVFTRYAIHGTNQPWVIGTRASHGCIRMYNRDVLELWPQVPLGTMVVTRD